jgi:hypothetical protein
MSASIFKTVVYGDNYDEIIQSAEDEICEFLEIPCEDLQRKVNYELIIYKDDSIEASLTYKAEVIARIR